MKFTFHSGINLPFILLDQHPSFLPLSKKDVHVLSNPCIILMSVADQTNQNLIGAKKELLQLYWIFLHTNFSWIQSLFRKPKDGIPPILCSCNKLTGDMVARQRNTFFLLVWQNFQKRAKKCCLTMMIQKLDQNGEKKVRGFALSLLYLYCWVLCCFCSICLFGTLNSEKNYFLSFFSLFF